MIDTRQRHARAREPEAKPAGPLTAHYSSHDMEAMTEPRISAKTEPRISAEDTQMPEAPSAQQPRATTQHSDASGGFAVDFGDTATSSEGGCFTDPEY